MYVREGAKDHKIPGGRQALKEPGESAQVNVPVHTQKLTDHGPKPVISIRKKKPDPAPLAKKRRVMVRDIAVA